MKKSILLILAFFLYHDLVQAQFKLGLNIYPAVVGNRITSDADTITYVNNGNAIRIPVGVFLDIQIKENYFFNTGIYWAPKTIHLKLTGPERTNTEMFKLQYIQIPFNLKLKTDEIALDKRLFFQLGPALDIKVDESIKNDPSVFYIKKFNFWDLSLNFSGGLEIKIGQNTSLFGGLSYSRGMINVAIPVTALKEHLSIKNDYYALNFGILF